MSKHEKIAKMMKGVPGLTPNTVAYINANSVALAAYDAGYRAAIETCQKVADECFEQINRDAQTYSLSHQDEKSFALNQQRLGAMAVAAEIRKLGQ